MLNYLLFLLLYLSFSFPSYSQNMTFNRYDSGLMTEVQFMKNYSHNGFSPELHTQSQDKQGNVHKIFRYRHENGIPLVGCGVNTHGKIGGSIYLVNGTRLINSLPIPSGNIIGMDKVTATLDQAFESDQYSIFNNKTRTFTFQANATLNSHTKSVYFSSSLDGNLSEVKHCYEVVAKPVKETESVIFYIDAYNGKIISSNRHVHHIENDVVTFYHGVRSVEMDDSGSEYTLLDAPRNIRTYYGAPGVSNIASSPTPDFSGYTGADQGILDSHWGIGVTHDYFNETHGYIGFDNNPATTINNYYISGMSNAYYSPSENHLVFGDGSGTPYTSVDIVGHEFTHGIISHTADLFYSGESGALNEAFADIFGLAVENYATGTYNWLIGEQVVPGGIRSFEDPGSILSSPQPWCYGGPHWQDTEGGSPTDNFGVHSNSGVMNHWFYLMVEGGTGSNCGCAGATSEAYDVGSAINFAPGSSFATSFELMTDILFYALINGYVGLNTEYIDMRNASIAAAQDLGYSCAFIQNMEEAWHAVCVGGTPVPCSVDAELTANIPSTPCTESEIFFTASPFNPEIPGTYIYNWNMGDGTVYTNAGSSVSHTFSTAGTYIITVELIDGSLGSGFILSGTDQISIGIFESCDPTSSGDCSANAGPPQGICHGESAITLTGVDSEDFNNLPNVQWSIVNYDGAASINLLTDIFFDLSDDPFEPVVTYLGGVFPEGEYTFQICVDCQTSNPDDIPMVSCNQSAVVTIHPEPTQPEIFTDPLVYACNTITLPINEPIIGEEISIALTNDTYADFEYVQGEGIVITMDEIINGNIYWYNFGYNVLTVSYSLTGGGCVYTSNEVTIDFMHTQYDVSGMVDGQILNNNENCEGPEKLLDGSRPGNGASAIWELISAPGGSSATVGSTDQMTGDAEVTLDVAGQYVFHYTVFNNAPCEESTFEVTYNYSPVLVEGPVLNRVIETICDPLTTATTFQFHQPYYDNTVYSVNASQLLNQGSVDIQQNGNEFDITFTPGASGQVEFIDGSYLLIVWGTKYLLSPDCGDGTSSLIPVEFPNINAADNSENAGQHIENFILEYIQNETTCFDGLSGTIEVNFLSNSNDYVVFHDGVELSCPDLPCLETCRTSESFRLFEGGTLYLEDDQYLFCGDPLYDYTIRLADYINSIFTSSGQSISINVSQQPAGASLPTTGIHAYTFFDLSTPGTYTFHIALNYYVDGVLTCWDVDDISFYVGEPFGVTAGEPQVACPGDVINLVGNAPPEDMVGLTGTWTQINCGGNCDAIIADPHNNNTTVLIPYGTCNSIYTFEWLFDPDEPGCEPISATTTVTVNGEEEGCDCNSLGCQIADMGVSGVPECIEPGASNCILLDVGFIGTSGSVVDFTVSPGSDFQILSSNNTATGTNTLLGGEANPFEICFEYSGSASTGSAVFNFTGTVENGAELCSVEISQEIPICEEPCSIEPDILVRHLACIGDDENGIPQYEFFFFFGLHNATASELAHPITLNAMNGQFSDVVQSTPTIHPITGAAYVAVSGTFTPDNLDIDQMCFGVDFLPSTLCDIEPFCVSLPECTCSFENINLVSEPDCVYPGMEQCFEISFDFNGEESIPFYVSESAGSGITVNSVTNSVTGTREIVSSETNVVEICFTYDGNCGTEGFTFDFEGIIKGGGCEFDYSVPFECCECITGPSAKINHIQCGEIVDGIQQYDFTATVYGSIGVPDPILNGQNGAVIVHSISESIDLSGNITYNISGTYTPSYPNPFMMCFSVEFPSSEYCDIESVCRKLPDCACQMELVNAEYSDISCIESGIEYCMDLSVEYSGSSGQSLVLESNNPAFSFTSVVNTATGTNELIPGTVNEFQVCFTYSGDCPQGLAILSALGSIEGEECSFNLSNTYLCCGGGAACSEQNVIHSMSCDSTGGLYLTTQIDNAPDSLQVADIIVEDAIIDSNSIQTYPIANGGYYIAASLEPLQNAGEICWTIVFTDSNICNVQHCQPSPNCGARQATRLHQMDDIEVFPNPTNGELMIALNGHESGNKTYLMVFDGLGRLVLSEECVGCKRFEIDISAQKAGIYYIRVESEFGSKTEKVIKR